MRIAAEYVPPKSPPGILTLVATDVGNFILFFGYFMVERLAQPKLFGRSAAMLDMGLGLLNTVILITSGWLVAMAVEAGRDGNGNEAQRLLRWAIGIGSCFGLIKALEYGDEIGRGITPQTNAFFQFYFVLTGAHLLHFIVGIGLLAVSLLRMRRRDDAAVRWLESCGLFWHMVDVLWVFLFAMLYLQGAL